MSSIISKYPFNVQKSCFLIMVVMRICVLIIFFMLNVAIVPSVQTSSSRTVLLTQRQWLSHVSQQPANEEWLLSLVTESMAVRRQGRTNSGTDFPGSTDSAAQCLPWFQGNLREYQRSRNGKQCCLQTSVQNWTKITLNGKWFFLGSVFEKIQSSALISV